MTRYAVALLEEIEALTDGREPFRPVRHHFGITSFGVNAWTAGDETVQRDRDMTPKLAHRATSVGGRCGAGSFSMAIDPSAPEG